MERLHTESLVVALEGPLRKSNAWSVGLSLLVLTANLANAEPGCETPLGRLVSAQGGVEVRHQGQAVWMPAALEQSICTGDAVRVGEFSRAGVWMANETVIRLDSGTTLTFLPPPDGVDGIIDLLRGAVHFLSRVSRTLQVRTPFVNAGIEGTEFTVHTTDNETQVTVFEGQVALENPGGTLKLSAGESAIAGVSSAPRPLLLKTPRDTITWALYYPPIVDYELFSPSQTTPLVEGALAAYRAGRTDQAIEQLSAIVVPGVQSAILTLRASLLLSVGRVTEAESDLDRVRVMAGDDGVATALRSIIALAQGQVDAALDLAQTATELAPDSPTPWVALSYAEQARFDLPAAALALETALDVSPNNALAYARMAELRLSLGERQASLAAAQRAVELNHALARTQTVLGFGELSALAARQAEANFMQAIELNSADPASRLGLGLALIRQGRLEPGREQIEIAASLDPGSGLIRSYLGKAYYQERRDGIAAAEFAIAKELDPSDPTPWFYDALRSLADNDPIGALRNLERSIALNDNRAVTRSSLLLDGDRGARTGDQGQVFRELGFERLIPGLTARSLITEPGSPAIHRLQASANRPREQSARVSELLQWQLNAPLTNNLLPIQQTEADLVVTSAAELLAPSETEWSQMFSTDGPFAHINAVGGSKNLFSDDLGLGYQYGPIVVGLGQYHYEFDGYADNNDQKRDIYGATVQWQPAPSTVLFSEYRHDERDFGDLSLGFGVEDIAPDFRTRINSDRWRLGLRQSLRPNMDLIATVAGFDGTVRQTDRVVTPANPMFPFPVTTGIRANNDNNGWLGELQFVYRGSAGALNSGAGYYDSNSVRETIAASSFEIPGIGSMGLTDYSRDKNHTRHKNAYAYWSATPYKRLSYTLGLAYDDYRGLTLDRDQFSPKFGVLWEPADGLQLRAVAARSLKRALVAEQTLEPTQVAGFTQMFDDLNGTDAKLYGIAMDARLGTDVFLGAELRGRDLTVPYTDQDGDNRRTDWKERNGALYAYWTPTDNIAVRAELLYGDLTYDQQLPRRDVPWSTRSLKTTEVPLSVAYFSPRGYSARFVARWIDQDARLVKTFDPTATGRSESDRFWTADLEFGYRLPKHYGRVTLGARNLFDQDFGYQEPDLNHPNLARERTFYLSLSLAL